MNLKINIHPILAMIIIAGALILLFTVFKGCKQSRIEVAEREKAERLADSALKVIKIDSLSSDSTKKEFQIQKEFLSGQVELAKNQKEKAEADLDKQIAINNDLIEKHKIGQYVDTNATLVPKEYIMDCEECFTNLEKTNKEVNKYKSDINILQDQWSKKDQLYQNRFKQLEQERIGFYTKISSLAQQQKETADKLKPHGRLYLSWNVLFGPWPKMAGAGFMYQTKSNMMYEANWLYGNMGHMIEASMKFPLSIKL